MKGKLYLRGRTWWMRYRHRGQEYRLSCETENQALAHDKLDLTLAKIRITGTTEPRDVRLVDLVNDYIKERRATNVGFVATSAERNWRLHLAPFFENAKVSELATRDFTEYRAYRLAQNAAQASVNREPQVIIAAYKLAYRSTPQKVDRLPYIRLVKEDNARCGFITDVQRDSLFAAASREGLSWRVLLEMAYLLGWRKSELLNLRVSDISIVDRTIRLARSKNGEAREVPMTERLALLMQQLISGRATDQRIFPKLSGSFERDWARIKTAAGCPDVLFHDWRRTSARTKRHVGVPEGVIMQLQGWKTAAMFRRYAITNLDDTRRALELVTRTIPAQTPPK